MTAAEPGPATVGDAVGRAAERLRAAGVDRPRTEAERLMALVLGTDRGGVLARRPDALPSSAGACFDDLVGQRTSRVPFQHLTGVQEFRGLPIAVDGRVLIPRPETEEVVEAVLALPPPPGGRVADLGTGSGCIAIALALERADLEVLALDRSAGALDVARANAERLGARVAFAHGDLAAPPAAWEGTVDVVVSNPPYVSEAEWEALAPEVRDFEPREALVPGPTGLEAYAALLPATHRLLRAGGAVVLELGHASAAQVVSLARGHGFAEVVVRPDLRGIERILVARRLDGRP